MSFILIKWQYELMIFHFVVEFKIKNNCYVCILIIFDFLKSDYGAMNAIDIA